MTGWTPGAPVIERLLQQRRLERVLGAHADGSPWLDRARQTIAAARAIEQASPDSAFVLAYDAARQACTALLAQQGLRPTTSGLLANDLARAEGPSPVSGPTISESAAVMSLALPSLREDTTPASSALAICRWADEGDAPRYASAEIWSCPSRSRTEPDEYVRWICGPGAIMQSAWAWRALKSPPDSPCPLRLHHWPTLRLAGCSPQREPPAGNGRAGWRVILLA
jgi:hypothetical protein